MHSMLTTLPSLLLLAVLGVGQRSGSDAPIIDTHVHNLFVTAKLNYSLGHAFPDLAKRPWDMSDFVNATGQRAGISAVLMELDKEGDIYSQSLHEAELYQQVANRCSASQGFCSVAGIVASAPVTSGAEVMRRFLPELRRVAPLVRGVREALWHRLPSSFVNHTYWESLQELARHDLVLDLLVNATQLKDVAKLAAALPELRINVDHLGYPNVKAATFDQDWANGITALAALPNVYAKLSGLPQAFGGKGWLPSDFHPYISFALKAFGPRRINFAGNWFVLNEFGTYERMLAAIKECLVKDLPATSIQEVMGGTATRLYRLGDSSSTVQQLV